MKLSSLDLDWALTVVAALIFAIVAISLGYNTGQSNGKITEKIAVACVQSGGTWTVVDGNRKAGCIRP